MLEPAKLAVIYRSLGSAFYVEKSYDLAASSFDKALAIDPRNVDALKTIGEVRVSQGRKADGVAYFQRAIQALSASGRKPEENIYKRALGVAYEASLPVSVDLGRQWAAAYPNAESWHNSVAIYRNMTKPDIEGTLDLLRLLRRGQCADRHRLQPTMRPRRSTSPTSSRPRRCSSRACRQSRSTQPTMPSSGR